jgi:glycosyltransferase involved in cell wall biosynthesis
MKTISAIVPAYNEAPRIERILSTLSSHPLINEVVVVDDGSKDNTIELVQKFALQFPKINLIIHEKNQGKSAAVATGIKAAHGDFIALIDADLLGITEENISKLIEPVLNGSADITISLRKNTPGVWRAIGLDYISGERVIPREFLLKICDEFHKLPRFGLESFMNRHMIKDKLRIKIIDWPNVESPFKYKKVGLVKGIWGETKMIWDIFRTITPVGPVYQIIQMKRLEIK